MTESEQREHKARPRNIQNGLVRGFLEVKQDYCAADFGTVTVVGSGTFLRIGGEDMIGFHLGDRNLEVSLRLFSETDELILEIDRNEWVSGDPLPWDIEAGWQVLTLREKARHISVSLNAKAVPLEVRAEFRRFGKVVTVNEHGIRVGGRNGNAISNLALVGMLLEVEIDETGFKIGPISGHSHGCFISWSNRRERLWKAKDVWKKIEAGKIGTDS